MSADNDYERLEGLGADVIRDALLAANVTLPNVGVVGYFYTNTILVGKGGAGPSASIGGDSTTFIGYNTETKALVRADYLGYPSISGLICPNWRI